MTSSALRKKIHEYVDQADDNFLIIIHQLLEREINYQGFELSKEDIETSLRRRKELESGEVQPISHEQLLADVNKVLRKP